MRPARENCQAGWLARLLRLGYATAALRRPAVPDSTRLKLDQGIVPVSLKIGGSGRKMRPASLAGRRESGGRSNGALGCGAAGAGGLAPPTGLRPRGLTRSRSFGPGGLSAPPNSFRRFPNGESPPSDGGRKIVRGDTRGGGPADGPYPWLIAGIPSGCSAAKSWFIAFGLTPAFLIRHPQR